MYTAILTSIYGSIGGREFGGGLAPEYHPATEGTWWARSRWLDGMPDRAWLKRVKAENGK